jgi:hypothetical protein
MHFPTKLALESKNVLSFARITLLLANALGLGAMLAACTAWTTLKLPVRKKRFDSSPEGMQVGPPLHGVDQRLDVFMNAMMVLYLCFGMTGVMILVNNNIARAFAIGAAISLVRFRVKLDQPGFSAGLFFSVLTGMACGVDQIPTAWAMGLTFSIVQMLTLHSLRRYSQKRNADFRASPAPSAPSWIGVGGPV